MEYRISDKLAALKPSAIREIFKSLSDPTIISFAAGNPSPLSFPVQDLADLSADIFAHQSTAALQYSVTEGYPPFREAIRKRMAEKTALHLRLGTPVICEAAFFSYNNYCAADILRKTETGYDFYEVKNAPALREQFVKDAGFQYYIMNRCGVRIGRIFIVLHGPEEENPFLPVDITEQAKAYAPWVNEHIWDLNRMQKEKEEPRTEPGEQCTCPYECWYIAYCRGENRPPEQLRLEDI